jgi:hypothetical protein
MLTDDVANLQKLLMSEMDKARKAGDINQKLNCISAGQREYELGFMLRGADDPDMIQKSKNHLETVLRILREDGSSAFFLNATLSALASNLWAAINLSLSIEYHMNGAWQQYNTYGGG